MARSRPAAKTNNSANIGFEAKEPGADPEARDEYRAENAFWVTAKCGDSLREQEETAYWLELLRDAGLVSFDKLQPPLRECDQLTAIFVTIIKRCTEQGRNQT